MADKKKQRGVRDDIETALERNAATRRELEERQKYELDRDYPKDRDAIDRVKSNVAGALIGVPVGTFLGSKLGKVISRGRQIRKTGGWSSGGPEHEAMVGAGGIGGAVAGGIGTSELAYGIAKKARSDRAKKYEKRRK